MRMSCVEQERKKKRRARWKVCPVRLAVCCILRNTSRRLSTFMKSGLKPSIYDVQSFQTYNCKAHLSRR